MKQISNLICTFALLIIAIFITQYFFPVSITQNVENNVIEKGQISAQEVEKEESKTIELKEENVELNETKKEEKQEVNESKEIDIQQVVRKSGLIEEKFQNRSVYILIPQKVVENPKIIFYLHGGAYKGSLKQYHFDFANAVSENTGDIFVIPDYPLAPKYQYTDVFAWISPLYNKILEKVNSSDIIFMGDSAGGGMALALAEKINQENKSNVPSKVVLISPWLDVSMENPEIEILEPQVAGLNSKSLKKAGIEYAGSKENVKNNLVSPIYGSLEGISNITIFTGTYDILNPDVHKLNTLAKKQGTYIQIYETEGAAHNWILNAWKGQTYLEDFQKLINVIENKNLISF